ncbi:MAG: class I SAM-dependent methyltransferase [Alphaproteobacteria bacterium]|nr:class I SAM-dependent methyltransferase [Alphaproteobacteria bacterium]
MTAAQMIEALRDLDESRRQAALAVLGGPPAGLAGEPGLAALAADVALHQGREADALLLLGAIDVEDPSALAATSAVLAEIGAVRRVIALLERARRAGCDARLEALAGSLHHGIYNREFLIRDMPWPFDPARLGEPALPRMSPACRDVASRILTTGHAEGEPTPLTGGQIPAEDGDVLFQVVAGAKPRRVLEIGFATGLSTLYMLAAGSIESHTVMDPLQRSAYRLNGLRNVAAAGFDGKVTLIERPSNVGMPALLAEGHSYDMIFIDASHSFENTFLEAFHADQMAEPGALLVFHDQVMEPVQAVLEFLRTNRGYVGITHANVAILRRDTGRGNHEQQYVPFRTRKPPPG